MKLLFIMEHLYPIVGGAERSIATLMEALRERGVECRYVCSTHMDSQALRYIHECDMVVTQLTWADEAVKLARTHGKKSILFVRSFENICKVFYQSETISHCSQQCHSCPHRNLLDNIPDCIVANSLYTQEFLRVEHQLESEVIYPFIDFEAVKAASARRRYLTMNQFAYHKGADIFLKIAAVLPQYDFRVVGYQCWAPTVPVPENVTLTGPIEARDIYAESMIFLAPARWNETFGRTLVEAQSNGVPVIASDRGAARVDNLVPEEQRIDDIENIDLWVNAIERILQDYPGYVRDARDQDLTPYALDSTVNEFYQLAQSILSNRSSHIGEHQ